MGDFLTAFVLLLLVFVPNTVRLVNQRLGSADDIQSTNDVSGSGSKGPRSRNDALLCAES